MKFFQSPPYQFLPLDEEGLVVPLDKDEFPLDDKKPTTEISEEQEKVLTIQSYRVHLPFFYLPGATSPAVKAIELYDTQFANAFNKRGKYIGPPTPELEEAWFKLWDQAEILVPEDQMVRLNVSNDKLGEYMKAPEDEGIGYVAGLEVFHQLHCLNYVRQFTWFLMDKYTETTLPAEFKDSMKALRIHTDHCIETLRLALMCHSDVTPVLVKMDGNYDPPRPQAEFNSYHRCRNFDKIVEWNEEHGLSTFGNVNHHGGHDHEHHN